MKKPKNHEALTLLLHKLLEGRITDEEREQLEDHLRRDPEARLLYFQYVDLQVELGCLVPPAEKAAPEVRAVPSDEWVRPHSNIRKKTSSWLALLTALCLLATLGWALWSQFGAEESLSETSLASVQQIEGEVLILDENGTAQRLTSRWKIQRGRTIQSRNRESSASLTYSDGTRLVLGGSTTLKFQKSESKSIELKQGSLTASVVPQPVDRPMTIDTPIARVEVIGTRFSVESTADLAKVLVREGEVRVVRRLDGKELRVRAGMILSLRKDHEPTLAQMERLTPNWSENFEQGIRPGWTTGKITSDNLPPGSTKAVRAVRNPQGAGHLIATPGAWSEGLFSLKNESQLEIVFRQGVRGPLEITVAARSLDPAIQPATQVLRVSPAVNHPANEWLEMKIPLKSLHHRWKMAEPGSLFVYSVRVQSKKSDPGLILDQIRSSLGKNETIEVHKLR